MKRLSTFLTVLFVIASVWATSPKREFRSVWLTTYQRIDWPSSSAVGNETKCKQELCDYLDKYQDRNFTGVCLHVRTWADAVYTSSYEPWSEWLTGTRGKDPGWDPLAYAVEECHKRGLECYAWINPFRFNRNNKARTTTQDLAVLAKDGWIIDNGTTTSHDEYQVFNPALSEVRQYLLNIIREIYTNYRIDGLLFDDYFYPNGIPATTQAQDYTYFIADNPSFSGSSSALASAMGDWRRNNINEFMRQLYEMIQQDRPDLRFGLSPAGIAREGCDDVEGLEDCGVGSDWQYDDIYSDPVAWLNDGSVDFISPQIYWFSRSGSNSYTTAAPYDKLCEWWSYAANFFGRHFYSSMAPYRFLDSSGNATYNNETHWEDLSHQIELNRQYNYDNAPGAIMYSAKYMDGPTCTGWGDYLEENSFQTKSLVPKITWKERDALTTPTVTFTGTSLTWTGSNTEETSYSPILRYTVYAIPAEYNRTTAMASDGDGIDAKFLLQVVYDNEYALPSNYQEGYWYAVCAYDGYGYESEPGYANEDVTPSPVARDETEYPTVGNVSITNLWFRSVLSGFSNIEFEENGKRNRGIVIAGDRVLICGREEDSTGPCYLKTYDLVTGYHRGDIELDIPTTDPYPANDIFRDNAGNIYISSLALNIQASSNAIRLYRFDTQADTVSLWATLNAEQSRCRVDHCTVEANSDGTYFVWAAVASNKIVIRWTLDSDGNILSETSNTMTEFCPSSATTFGIAPRIYALGNNHIVIDGANTAATEYDFTTGKIVSELSSALLPSGYMSNGFAHFGEDECYLAYASADHTSDTGYKFNVTNASSHSMEAQSLLWTIPTIDMGSTSSTTMSAPVDAVSETDSDGWHAYIAIYAPGNSVGVYKLTYKTSSGITEPDATETAYEVINGTVYFNNKVDGVSVYDLCGRCLAYSSNTSFIKLPEAGGIYIVRFGTKAIRIAVQ